MKVNVITTPKNRVSINSPNKDTVRTVGVGSIGVSNLNQLLDVDVDNLSIGDVLIWDGLKWVPTAGIDNFPIGDYGLVTDSMTDEFGVVNVDIYDCNAPGSPKVTDLNQ